MMNKGYDEHRRCLRSPLHVQEIQDQVPAEDVPAEAAPVNEFDEDEAIMSHPLFSEFKFDSKGRKYAYDCFGSRITPRGICKGGRPNTCSPMEWRHMSAQDKRETTAAYHAAEAKRTAASTPLFFTGSEEGPEHALCRPSSPQFVKDGVDACMHLLLHARVIRPAQVHARVG